MAIRVTITGNVGDLAKAVDFTDADRSLFAEAARRGMIPFVPIDTGNLTRSGHVERDEVVYDATNRGESYASYVHNMEQSRIKVGGRFAQWPEHYESTGMKEVVEEVGRAIDSKGV